MPHRMTKRQRLAATIAGQPVDRLPVALWRHFYLEEQTARRVRPAPWSAGRRPTTGTS